MLEEVAALKTEVDQFTRVTEKRLEDLPDERPCEIMIGSESTFHEVWRCLDEEQVGIIGLYGMGGVGKTTLLKKINNRFREIPNDFTVIWVTVSRSPQIENIQNTIGERIGLCDDSSWKEKSIEDKAIDILKNLSIKKFVLLLDDIWDRVDLETIGVPRPDCTNESKVVFTTRHIGVCHKMGADQQFKVERHGDAWELFASEVGDDTLNSDPEIHEPAELVAEECDGLKKTMAIREPFLSALLQVLFERLTNPELLQFAREVGVLPTLKKWEEPLKTIEAVLIDAEEKQLKDEAVKAWLDKLQDLAYDMEDILDEFATEALRRKLKIEHPSTSSKVRKLIPDVFTSLRRKIEENTSCLESFCKEITSYGFAKISGRNLTADYQRPFSTSLPTEPAIYGRDEDKAKILDMVFSDEPTDANFSVITIVGMGGIGKTTLARVVFNNKLVLEDFNLRAWVRVPEYFDVLRISKAILTSITSRSCDMKDLDQVQLQLKESLAGRKFLFVLDDVRSGDYHLWKTLIFPFMEGAPGSKIIMTTRLRYVALTMGTGKCYDLKLLSDEDCWLILAEHAFPNANLKEIPHEVAQKCKGLPLVAKTLGGLLHSIQREDEWLDILNSEIWNNRVGHGIPAGELTVSYYNLPSHLKRCFTYCAMLPADYEFKEKELVLLWMAEGLIQQSNDNMQLEDLGSEYFRNLVSRSIFQKSDSDDSKFGMHNLIHELARRFSGDFSRSLADDLGDYGPLFWQEKTRYCSYTGDFYDGTNKFQVISKLQNLRTFLLLLTDDHTGYVADTILSDLLTRFKKLRVLSLRNYHITVVPDSIGNWTSLRYLNFSGTEIRSLPESINMLFNLQVLFLRDCVCLVNLPSNMGNLINLRHIDIRGTNLREMPLGIKNWESLRTLSDFIVGRGVGSSIKDLKDLKFLNGELCISSLENVIDSPEEVVLCDKKGLEVLILEWGSLFDNSRNEAAENEVLDMLQPHQNLKELTIRCYGGIHFPSWLGSPSLSDLEVLTLENCEKCPSLPSLGLLVSLKELTIRGMKGLKSIGSEIYGEGCSKPFQSLENLSFEDLDECEHWDPTGEAEHVKVFSRLRKLSIKRCPKLTVNFPDQLPSLQELVVLECAQLIVSSSSLPMPYKSEIDRCRAIMCRGPVDYESLNSNRSNISRIINWFKQVFQRVECFLFVNCEELMYFWQNESFLEKPPQGLHSLITLRELCIENCPNLTAIPEVDFLSVLSILKIENCNALMSLPEGLQHENACLQHLRIGGCHSLAFIFKNQLPSSLKRLEVKNCGKLQYLFNDGEATRASLPSSSSTMHSEIINNTCLSFVEHLYVSQCPSLTFLSSRVELLAVLKHLEISGCPKLVTLLSSGQLPETLQHLNVVDCPKLVSIAEMFHSNVSLEYIKIWRCKKLKLIPGNLNSLSCLRDIYLWDCPSLVSFPEGGLPDTNLRLFSIDKCRQLRALPQHMHRLNSLRELELRQCPSITSIEEEGLPTSLTSLTIADVSIYRPLIEWGLHKLTSLKNLEIRGCVYAESFPQEEAGMTLPTSLTGLTIARFPKLKYLSSTGLQNLSSLEYLSISDCPALESLPESGLPSSLVQLYIYDCPLLKKRCKKDKGEEWFKISHIPRIQIDGRFIEGRK